jgi:hypothetical protein
MSEIVLTCERHGDLTHHDVYRRKLDSGNISFYCIFCKKERARDWYLKNQDKCKAKARQAYRLDPEGHHRKTAEYVRRTGWNRTEKQRKRFREWARANLHKTVVRRRNYYRKISETINDTYVKKILTKHTGISFDQINDSLIELKRVVILLKREIKKQQGR